MAGAIYLTSDQHFNHDKAFIYEPRGFTSIEDMNKAYIERWNQIVNNDDDIYVLGDFFLGSTENIPEILIKLQGKIHLVVGNHDSKKRLALYSEASNIIEIQNAIYLDYKKYHFFLCHYPTLTGNLQKETLKQVTINLFGHTHQTNNEFHGLPYMYHCGVDSHYGYPVLIDNIIEELKEYYKSCRALCE